mmetsp:Transcript_102196/g.284641  ORF Transcript_102196/g.284641 Transcript_102196/m.284641 type:complete len:484 (-) Transcript_102196:91-1542(-)
MGCQAHKAALPEEVKAPPSSAESRDARHAKTLLTGPKRTPSEVAGAGAAKCTEEGRLQTLVRPRTGAAETAGVTGACPRPREDAERAEAQPIEEEEERHEESPASHSEDRKPSLAPSSTDSISRKTSTSVGIRSTSAHSSFSAATSNTPASARTSLSQRSRASWAMGHVQEETDSPTTSGAQTARRLITDQCLPEATPRVHCPEALWLVLPHRAHLQGQYCLMPGAVANGEPLWRQADGPGWLFSCSTGFWMVADGRDKVERNLGQLRTIDRHYAKLPHECHRWMYGEDSRNWVTETDGLTLVTADQDRALSMVHRQQEEAAGQVAAAFRRAASAPDTIWLAAPPKPFLQGEYRKATGHDSLHNDLPVWRQVNGSGCLASSSGHWVIYADNPEDVRSRPQIRSSVPHGGALPQEVSMWKYTNGTGGWATDYVRAVCASTDSSVAERSQANYLYLAEANAECNEKEEAVAHAAPAGHMCERSVI